MSVLITTIGLCAGFLTTIALLPQVIKTWREKSAKDLSLTNYICLTVGVFLWLLYGIFINDMPIIVANIVTLIFSVMVIVLKLRYGGDKTSSIKD